MKYTYKHIVVVHGIGDQAPNETVLGFMNEFIRALPRGNHYSVTVHNLIESVDDIKAASQTIPGVLRPRRSFHPAYIVFSDTQKDVNYVIGFSEVYWKQIPDEYIRQNGDNLPIPIFTWARSINARFLEAGRAFHLAREAIDNLEKMLGLLRVLGIIYKKSGQLTEITAKFLGDVQIYAESDEIRQEINNRFLSVLARVENFSEATKQNLQNDSDHAGKIDDFENREFYIIAHSEGTVVSLNSLVQAALLSEGVAAHPEQQWNDLFRYEEDLVQAHGQTAQASSWLPRIKGLVTLGSPIDKHYTIWRRRFRLGHLKKERERKVCWFNYWDHSDPVGYGLKEVFYPDAETRQGLPNKTTDAEKLFEVKYDKGFTRYLIPGLAHIKYWQDNAIYEHIIDEAMGLGTTRWRSTAVRSRWWWPFHRVLDGLVYILSRIATLGALLFFLTNLLSPIWNIDQTENLLPMIRLFPATEAWGTWTLLIFAPLLLIKGLWKMYGWLKGWLAKMIYGLRVLLMLAWALVVFDLCLELSAGIGVEATTILDWLGYLTGLVVSCLVWSLHTTIHKGIIQMWHYTKGKGTAVHVSG